MCGEPSWTMLHRCSYSWGRRSLKTSANERKGSGWSASATVLTLPLSSFAVTLRPGEPAGFLELGGNVAWQTPWKLEQGSCRLCPILSLVHSTGSPGTRALTASLSLVDEVGVFGWYPEVQVPVRRQSFQKCEPSVEGGAE